MQHEGREGFEVFGCRLSAVDQSAEGLFCCIVLFRGSGGINGESLQPDAGRKSGDAVFELADGPGGLVVLQLQADKFFQQ